jgi:hypothetical protein
MGKNPYVFSINKEPKYTFPNNTYIYIYISFFPKLVKKNVMDFSLILKNGNILKKNELNTIKLLQKKGKI